MAENQDDLMLPSQLCNAIEPGHATGIDADDSREIQHDKARLGMIPVIELHPDTSIKGEGRAEKYKTL